MRVAPFITAAIALAFVSCARADTFVWTGDKTNWDYYENWEGASVYDDVKVSRTVIKTALPVTAYVTGEPYIGKSIRLAKTGRLVLRSRTPGEEVKLIFSNGTDSLDSTDPLVLDPADERVATYVGGQRRGGSNDMHCQNNWKMEDGSPAIRAPCDRDEIMIPEGDSVAITTVSLRTNVKSFTIDGDEMTCSELNKYNFIRIPCASFHIDNEEVCYKNDCHCPSVCPSQEQLLSDNLRQREEAFLQSNEKLEQLDDTVERTITGSFEPGVLGLDKAFVIQLFSDTDAADLIKEALKAAIEAALLEKLGNSEDGTTIILDHVDIDQSTGILAVTGTITGPKRAFLRGDDTPEDVLDNGVIDLNAGDFNNGGGNNNGGGDNNGGGSNNGGGAGGNTGDIVFGDIVKKAIGDTLHAEQTKTFERVAQETKDNCVGDCAPVFKAIDVLVGVVVSLRSNNGGGSNNDGGSNNGGGSQEPAIIAEQVIRAVIDAQCEEVVNKTGCIQEALAATAPGATVDTITTLAEEIAKLNVSTAAMTEPGSPLLTLLQLASMEDYKTLAADLKKFSGLPLVTTVTSPSISLGQGLGRPTDDYGLMVSSPNNEVFAQKLVDSLESFGEIINILLSSVKFDLVVSEASGQTIVEEIVVQFQYTTLCTGTEIDAGACGFNDGDSAFIAIQGILDDLLNTFELAPPPCVSFETGFDAACLAQKAIDAYTAAKTDGKSDDEAAAAANAALKALVECGFSGRNPSTGKCVEEDEEALDEIGGLTEEAAAAYAAANPTDDPDASTDSGLPIVPIAAGAGGALLLIIIIIIIVFVRKNKEEDAAAAGDKTPARSVVAFENPMYDDPTQADAAYDAPAGDEGLYDEPAFTAAGAAAADRTNPLYQSNEDLAGAGEEEGYLDVAPEE